ncbi:GNAT family N-acetyltransferase [uncultured Ruminococcus sp.]|jgi:predicted N-acetyltransferase YhbS|uniref:GNAT family N-acetyltransferase n=1 Tax=uncultured Ruminococcus sp. TaxID=165186 RepID=UPI0026051AFF|nr:GNAT family N-acetyltransferase [uncultured Ruminococcus sp.]
MQEVIIRQANINDIDTVTELENSCFHVSEAADRKAFELRLRNYPECFRLLEIDGKVISMINGMTTNENDLCDEMYSGTDMYAAHGKWLMLFGVATAPAYQKRGFASRLMERVIEDTKKQERRGIVLTCKEELLTFYSRFGFVSEGISDSEHGGAEWYQMRFTLE